MTVYFIAIGPHYPHDHLADIEEHTFTKVLAKEVGQYGITVNAIAPYGTMPEDVGEEISSGSRFHPVTGIFPKLVATRSSELDVLARKGALTRRYARAPEIGAAAVYLASVQAAFITGQIHCVDGGCLL